MPFKKGQSGNPVGRKEGVPNKDKQKLRESIAQLLDDNQEKFNREFFKLDGAAFIDRFINLLEYCTPKLNRTDLVSDDEKINCINFTDVELINKLNQFTKPATKKGAK